MSQLVVLKIMINQITLLVKNIMTTNIYIAFTTILTFIICNVMSCGNNYIIIEVTWLSLSINPFMLRPNHHQKEGQSHTHYRAWLVKDSKCQLPHAIPRAARGTNCCTVSQFCHKCPLVNYKHSFLYMNFDNTQKLVG